MQGGEGGIIDLLLLCRIAAPGGFQLRRGDGARRSGHATVRFESQLQLADGIPAVGGGHADAAAGGGFAGGEHRSDPQFGEGVKDFRHIGVRPRQADHGVRPFGLEGRHLFGGGDGHIGGGELARVGGVAGGGQREATDGLARLLHHHIPAVGDAVAAPAGGAGQQRVAGFCEQIGGDACPRGGGRVGDQPLGAERQIRSVKRLQIVACRRESAGHVHTAGQAGAHRSLKAAAHIQQDRIRVGGLEGRQISKADLAVVGPAAEIAGEIDRHCDAAHPHRDLSAPAAIRQGGGDGAFALALCFDHALFADGGHRLIVAGPVNFLTTVGLRRLVGGQRRFALHPGQPQFIFIGIVGEGCLPGVLHAGEHQLFHHKVHIHRIALNTVFGARLSIGALPEGIGAGIAQLGVEPGNPEMIPPAVKGRIGEAGAGPVDGGIDALLPLITQLAQAVKKDLGQMGHLLGVQPGDGLVLQVIVDGVIQVIGVGGVILQPLMGRADQAQQPGHMLGLRPGLFLGGGVGIEIGAKGNAQPGTLVGIAAPLLVILGIIALAVPLAAKTAAQDSKVNPGGLGLLPVHLALIFAHINALFCGSQNGLPGVIEIIPRVVLLPRAGRGARVNGGRTFGAAVAGHQQHNDQHHRQQHCSTCHKAALTLPAESGGLCPLLGRRMPGTLPCGTGGGLTRFLILTFLLFHNPVPAVLLKSPMISVKNMVPFCQKKYND